MDITIDCICPPKDDAVRHPDGDTITLRDAFGFHDALALRKDMAIAVDGDATSGDGLAALSEGYLLRGISDWTLVDEKGKPVPVTKAEITARLLSDLDAAMVVSDAADALYAEAILLPLVRRAERWSQRSPANASTSQPKDSPSPSRTPSKRSSTSTTQTDGTGTITALPGGVSRSSRNSASAA